MIKTEEKKDTWFGCVGPGFRYLVMDYLIFLGFGPLAHGGVNSLLPSSGDSRMLGLREGSYGKFNPNTSPAAIQ